MNNDTRRNFMILIAGSVFAGMLVGPALAQSPCEATNETQATLDSEIFKGVADMGFKIPASNDLNSPKQDHFSYLADYV